MTDMLLSPILKNFGTDFSNSGYSRTDQKLWLSQVPVPHRAAVAGAEKGTPSRQGRAFETNQELCPAHFTLSHCLRAPQTPGLGTKV